MCDNPDPQGNPVAASFLTAAPSKTTVIPGTTSTMSFTGLPPLIANSFAFPPDLASTDVGSSLVLETNGLRRSTRPLRDDAHVGMPPRAERSTSSAAVSSPYTYIDPADSATYAAELAQSVSPERPRMHLHVKNDTYFHIPFADLPPPCQRVHELRPPSFAANSRASSRGSVHASTPLALPPISDEIGEPGLFFSESTIALTSDKKGIRVLSVKRKNPLFGRRYTDANMIEAEDDGEEAALNTSI